ncbi:hypothetical protein HPB50_016068 [Hyalomma asiaticum]|uniref:Uncharacterized protein n=1 Tax=Hyalomma asiaticum TaxID=266040 RepID=A0ACB7T1B0_HYAAI|nr:hypothetical protein HPB50_016068 [Hyalomma asiaticum]
MLTAALVRTYTRKTTRISVGHWLPADDPILKSRTLTRRYRTWHGTRHHHRRDEESYIVKASRRPQLTEEHRKIIFRPRGGLNLSKLSTTIIAPAAIEASGLTADQAKEDVVCPNFTQNIVVVSTPKADHAARHVRTNSFKIVDTDGSARNV